MYSNWITSIMFIILFKSLKVFKSAWDENMKINREIKLKDYTYIYKVINQIKSYVTQAERTTVFSSVVGCLHWNVTAEIQYTIFKCPTFKSSKSSRSLLIFHISTWYAEYLHHLAHINTLEIKKKNSWHKVIGTVGYHSFPV